MSKKASIVSGWADLPAELLVIISDCLSAPDIRRFRWVCRPWRSSVMAIPNKLSPFFPHSLSSCCLDPWPEVPDTCQARPNYLIANAIYLVRPLKTNPDSEASTFMISLQESKAGKLLLRHALTYHRIIRCSGDSLDFSGWSISPIAVSHNFRGRCDCMYCDCLSSSRTKVVTFNSMALFAPFYHRGRMFALRSCGSNNGYTQLIAGADCINRIIEDFINFNGRIYAVDDVAAHVYVLHHNNGGLQLLRLTCVGQHLLNFGANSRLSLPVQIGKRFLVSDGDLYLILNDCEKFPKSRHRCYIYKLVMDDINNATSYSLEKVYNLGDRVFFINQDCSFSVSAARDLHLPHLGNHIFVTRSAFLRCDCKGFRIHHAGGKPAKTVPAHSALFQPPSLWFNQLGVSPKDKKKKKKKKLQLSPTWETFKVRIMYSTEIRSADGEGDDTNPVY